jgi:hypothetical protein
MQQVLLQGEVALVVQMAEQQQQRQLQQQHTLRLVQLQMQQVLWQRVMGLALRVAQQH